MNSRLTVAAHILGMLAYLERSEKRAATSDELAASIGTSPVVVRRVLAQLNKAGLVTSRRGVGGGTVLSRDPLQINLRQAYQAVEPPETAILKRYAGHIGASCHMAPVIAEYLDEIYADAEKALLDRLAAVNVDTMSRDIEDRLRRRAAVGK